MTDLIDVTDAHEVIDFIPGHPLNGELVFNRALAKENRGHHPVLVEVNCAGNKIMVGVDVTGPQKQAIIEPVGQDARRLVNAVKTALEKAWLQIGARLGVDLPEFTAVNLSSAANMASVKSAGTMFSAPVAHSVTPEQAIKAVLDAYNAAAPAAKVDVAPEQQQGRRLSR